LQSLRQSLGISNNQICSPCHSCKTRHTSLR
jgi:hypothetical protein